MHNLTTEVTCNVNVRSLLVLLVLDLYYSRFPFFFTLLVCKEIFQKKWTLQVISHNSLTKACFLQQDNLICCFFLLPHGWTIQVIFFCYGLIGLKLKDVRTCFKLTGHDSSILLVWVQASFDVARTANTWICTLHRREEWFVACIASVVCDRVFPWLQGLVQSLVSTFTVCFSRMRSKGSRFTMGVWG